MNKDEIDLFRDLIKELVQLSKRTDVLESKHDRQIEDMKKEIDFLNNENIEMKKDISKLLKK